MDAVEELGYSPDASGRTFRTGKKMMIGLVVPDITNSVFAALIEDVDDVISKQGYNLVISNTRDCLKMEKQALRNLASGVVDGIVIASTSEDFKTIKRQIPDKFPMIFMDRVLPDRNYDSVILDCQEATAKMLEEMIQNGFRKIGFLVGLPQISPTYERVKVYQQILKQYEIPETEQYVRYIDRKKDTYDVAGELVEAGCTAIIATNTAMTHSVLNYVEDRNLKLGEEIAVGGFVDSDFANRFMHRIPVVYEPMKEMGKLAGEMIVEKIEDKNRKIPVKTLTCEYDSNDFYKKQAGRTKWNRKHRHHTNEEYDTREILRLECLHGEGHMYATDVDQEESAQPRKRLAEQSFGEDILTVKLQNFCTIDEIAKEAGGFDFILADFGGSFMQIDNLKRGFSFRADGPLDLRLNQEKGISAAEPDPQKCAGG